MKKGYKLPLRLETVASFVTPGNILVDVGCDHGYLSISLVKRGLIPRAIASDVRPGPLMRAKEHILECALQDKIEARLSDGLDRILPGEGQTLVIAGMGGPLMERILRKDPPKSRSFRELILEPQSDLPHFRRFLLDHAYSIIDEELVMEEGKFYPVIKAVPLKAGSEEAYSPAEYAFGRILIRKCHPALLEFLEKSWRSGSVSWKSFLSLPARKPGGEKSRLKGAGMDPGNH